MHPGLLLLDTLRFDSDLEPKQLRTEWESIDSFGMRGLVAYEGCGLWLSRRLRQIEYETEEENESSFETWLNRTARHIAAQNLLVDSQADFIVSHLNDKGVPHVLLKGAALHLGSDLFPFGADRATNDIDLLVPESEAEPLETHLLDSGYEFQFPERQGPPNHFHRRPLVTKEGVPLEIHISTSKTVPSEEAWRRATTGVVEVEREGVKHRIPSPTELLWHGTSHGLAGSNSKRSFCLHFFQDAAAILASGVEIDWNLVESRMDLPEVPGRKRTVMWLGAAAWLAGTELPSKIAGGIDPFPLRRAIQWRLGVLRRFHLGSRRATKLLGEAMKAEVGWPVERGRKDTPFYLRARRRTAALVARGAYLAWRSRN